MFMTLFLAFLITTKLFIPSSFIVFIRNIYGEGRGRWCRLNFVNLVKNLTFFDFLQKIQYLFQSIVFFSTRFVYFIIMVTLFMWSSVVCSKTSSYLWYTNRAMNIKIISTSRWKIEKLNAKTRFNHVNNSIFVC